MHLNLAFEKIFEDVMLKNRRSELELYRLLATDTAFKAAMQESLRNMVEWAGKTHETPRYHWPQAPSTSAVGSGDPAKTSSR